MRLRARFRVLLSDALGLRVDRSGDLLRGALSGMGLRRLGLHLCLHFLDRRPARVGKPRLSQPLGGRCSSLFGLLAALVRGVGTCMMTLELGFDAGREFMRLGGPAYSVA